MCAVANPASSIARSSASASGACADLAAERRAAGMPRERGRQDVVAPLERRQHELPGAPGVGEAVQAQQRLTRAPAVRGREDRRCDHAPTLSRGRTPEAVQRARALRPCVARGAHRPAVGRGADRRGDPHDRGRRRTRLRPGRAVARPPAGPGRGPAARRDLALPRRERGRLGARRSAAAGDRGPGAPVGDGRRRAARAVSRPPRLRGGHRRRRPVAPDGRGGDPARRAPAGAAAGAGGAPARLRARPTPATRRGS